MLTACFEVTETATINDDGSGRFELTVDMSQSKQMIDFMKAMDTTGNAQSENEFSEGFEEKKRALSGIDGVDNIRVIDKQEEYVFGISFDFDAITTLNAALNTMYSREEPEDRQTYFTYDGTTFSRNDIVEGGADEAPTDSLSIVMLRDAHYHTAYTFRKEISSFTNDRATLSEDARTLTFSENFYNLLRNQSTLKNTVTFK